MNNDWTARIEQLEARNKALEAAFNSACSFIDCHVADPDITELMRRNYSEFERNRKAIPAAEALK